MRIALLTTDNRENCKDYDATAPYFGTAPEALLQGFEEMRDLEIHVVSCTQRAMQSPEKLADNIWFHSLLVPKIGWLRTGYQGCIRAVRRKLKEIRPDLVHGQGTERDCAIGAVFSGFQNVITIHGNMAAVARAVGARIGSFQWCSALLERFTLPRTFGVFCNSSHTESLVRPLARRTWRVPNAVRREFFDTPFPERSTSSSSKPILLNIGVIAPHKRQLELLDIAEELHREGQTFELRFIATVDSRSNYALNFKKRIKAEEYKGFARFLEPQSLSDLISSFDQATALIHVPSEEAFGLVVAEALSRNLKFFGTMAGGIPDIANGVECAELFSLGDDDALVTAITRWMDNGMPRPISAATEMRGRYHPETIARRHLGIYKELLEGGQRQ